jgi:hypothetical protein
MKEGSKQATFMLVSCFASSSTLKMTAACSSETAHFQRTTQHYTPYDRTLHYYYLIPLHLALRDKTNQTVVSYSFIWAQEFKYIAWNPFLEIRLEK